MALRDERGQRLLHSQQGDNGCGTRDDLSHNRRGAPMDPGVKVGRAITVPVGRGRTQGASPAGCDKFVGFSTPADGWATLLCPQGLSPISGSSDGGRTWTACRLAPLPAFYRVSPNDGFAQWDSAPVFDGDVGAVGLDVDLQGETSIVYRSTDGGDSWRPVVPPGRPRDWLVDIVSGSTWKLADGRTILTTTNGGQSWRAATSNLATSAGDHLDFVTARAGWYTPYSAPLRGLRPAGFRRPLPHDRRWPDVGRCHPSPDSQCTSDWGRPLPRRRHFAGTSKNRSMRCEYRLD